MIFVIILAINFIDLFDNYRKENGQREDDKIFANMYIFRAFFHVKLKNRSRLGTKQVFPILTNKNNEQTDHFSVFLPRQRLKRSLVIAFCP